MTTQSNIEIIKQVLKEINEAREWIATDAHIKQVFDKQYQEIRIAFYQKPKMDISGNVINLTEIDLIKITSLTKALDVAVDALEYYQGKLYHADKAINQVAEILEGK